VSNVRTNHKQILISDPGCFARINTWMDGYLLANNIIIAYHQAPKLGVRRQTQYLRPTTNRTVGEKVIAFANVDIFFNHHVGIQNRAGTDSYSGIDNAIGADRDIVVQLSTAVDNRAAMHPSHFFRAFY
jgi:hypothetical protein